MSQNEISNDLGSMISQLLSDPQKIQQIQQMASSLGLGSTQPSNAACPTVPPHPPQNGTTSPSGVPDLSSLIEALGPGQPIPSQSPDLDPSLIIGLQGIMQRFSKTNPGVELLRALRPLLSEKRAKKVDDAVRMMQLIQALPALKEIGFFKTGGGLL